MELRALQTFGSAGARASVRDEVVVPPGLKRPG